MSDLIIRVYEQRQPPNHGLLPWDVVYKGGGTEVPDKYKAAVAVLRAAAVDVMRYDGDHSKKAVIDGIGAYYFSTVTGDDTTHYEHIYIDRVL